MKKTFVKIIKRKDVEAMVSARTQSAGERTGATPDGAEKSERRLRREIVSAISSWIPEREKNNRLEEVAAVRKFFGNDLLSDEV